MSDYKRATGHELWKKHHENVPMAQFETDASSHVVFSLSVCFYILFIQLEAFSDSCAKMSASKLEIGSC